jgi:hypothetical protein
MKHPSHPSGTRTRCSSVPQPTAPPSTSTIAVAEGSRVRLKRDGTRAETIFRLSPKRTSPFKSAGGVISVDCW